MSSRRPSFSPPRTSPHLMFLLCVFLLLYYLSPSVGTSIGTDDSVRCLDEERRALLKFKQDIEYDQCRMLLSWGHRQEDLECCNWHGVTCSNHTRNVIRLDLSGVQHGPNGCFEGVVSSSLSELKGLRYLDLSFNFFGQLFPNFIGSLVNLRYLNLSDTGFIGEVPHYLVSLSRLRSLDLSRNYGMYSKSLHWLSHLCLLKEINLSDSDLSEAIDWFQFIGNLSFLRVLHLDGCRLSLAMPLSSPYANYSSNLQVVSLSRNRLNSSSIFQWLSNMSGVYAHLAHLDLSHNAIEGLIPDAFGNLNSLAYLDLSHNSLSGPIPECFALLSQLKYLDLSGNYFSGVIPASLRAFAVTAFTGNEGLCGEPLAWCCAQLQNGLPKQEQNDGNDDSIYRGLYVSIVLGFYFGFWGFCGSLVLKSSWRYAYFHYFDAMMNKMYVTITASVARLRKST